MIIKPSFSTGYAHTAAESANPNLWRGLKAAWSPSLGVTGSKLLGLGSEKLDATLVGATSGAWSHSRMGTTLDLVGDGQYLTVGTTDLGGDRGTIIHWVKPAFSYIQGTPFNFLLLGSGHASRVLSIRYNGASSLRRYEATYRGNFGLTSNALGTSFNSDEEFQQWTMLSYSWDQPANEYKLYQNGALVGTDATVCNAWGGTTTWRIGDSGIFSTGTSWTGKLGDTLVYDRVISTAEQLQLYIRPNSLFEPRERKVYFLPAVGGAISIDGTISPLVLSGLTGQVDQGSGINATPASLILTGAAGQVDLGTGINGTPATLDISGLAGQVDLGAGINGIAASLSIIGLTGAVTLGSDILINGTPASLLMAGQSGQVDLGVSINGSIASIILTGLAGDVSIGNDILINGTPAVITLSGLNATVTQETSINGTPSTITLNGIVGAVSQDITINGTPASIALSPITSEVVQNTIISGTPTTLVLSGITGSITSGAVVTILAAQTIEMKLYNTAIDMGLYNSTIEIKS